MAALAGAIPFKEMDGVASAVADGLHLKVSGLREVLLDIDTAVAKCRGCFLGRTLDCIHETGFVLDHPHPTPTTAGGRFDDDRIADFFGDLPRLFRIIDFAFGPGEDWGAGFPSHPLAGNLIAQQRHCFRTRPDEGNLTVTTDGGELRVLREEPIARMNRVCLRAFCRRDDAINPEVTIRRRTWPDADRFVGPFQPRPIGICRRVNADRRDAEFPARSNNPQRNLAAIGDQNSIKHDGSLTRA